MDPHRCDRLARLETVPGRPGGRVRAV